MRTLTLECACGRMKKFEVAGQDLDRQILNAGWLSLPGEKIVKPAVPHPELLPVELRDAASKLPPIESYPAKCKTCLD